MRIHKLTASFGKLSKETLALGSGLNIIYAPNEGGKSTWCAFLRAMFYGISTRERDKGTLIADKNRYAPWSGAPMEGTAELHWRGREITLHRFSKGSVPFGGFEAAYAETGTSVGELNGENAGELLLGVGRGVYERSAFVGQGALLFSGSEELERRITALVSTGEETISYTEAESALRDWRNRRKVNKSKGLIPRLEEEKACVEDILDRLEDARRRHDGALVEISALDTQRKELEAESELHRRIAQAALDQQYNDALAELEKARLEESSLRERLSRFGALPEREKLREAQGQLALLLNLRNSADTAESRLSDANRALKTAREEAGDPRFPGLDPNGADRKVSEDISHMKELERPRRTASLLGGLSLILGALAAFLAVSGALRATGLPNWAAPLISALFITAGLIFFLLENVSRRKRRAAGSAILSGYGAQKADELLLAAAVYREKYELAAQEERKTEALSLSLADLIQQSGALEESLFFFVRAFAPEVTDTYGISAALSRALKLQEEYSAASVRREGAEGMLAAVARAGGRPSPSQGALNPPARSPRETDLALEAAVRELTRLRSVLAMAKGEMNTLGDPAALEARREELKVQIFARQQEYRALEIASEVLCEANEALSARFSPALGRRAGELMRSLTGGAYGSLALARDFSASATEAAGAFPRKAVLLSQGTIDQLYLAVRLAVCELALPREDPAPLVLDDALTAFDDVRMGLALDCLRELGKERQILLFTCHRREGTYLAQMPGVTLIDLQTH